MKTFSKIIGICFFFSRFGWWIKKIMIQDLEAALKIISNVASSSSNLIEEEDITEALRYIWDFMLSKLTREENSYDSDTMKFV
jgi:hydrogenase maturation factor HypF (carbamoyltransferase family)